MCWYCGHPLNSWIECYPCSMCRYQSSMAVLFSRIVSRMFFYGEQVLHAGVFVRCSLFFVDLLSHLVFSLHAILCCDVDAWFTASFRFVTRCAVVLLLLLLLSILLLSSPLQNDPRCFLFRHRDVSAEVRNHLAHVLCRQLKLTTEVRTSFPALSARSA